MGGTPSEAEAAQDRRRTHVHIHTHTHLPWFLLHLLSLGMHLEVHGKLRFQLPRLGLLLAFLWSGLQRHLVADLSLLQETLLHSLLTLG